MPQRTLWKRNALDVIYVRMWLYAHYVLNCYVGNRRRGRVMVNYISRAALLRYSAACVQRAPRINREMKIGNENGLLSFFFFFFCIPLHNCGVFTRRAGWGWSVFNSTTFMSIIVTDVQVTITVQMAWTLACFLPNRGIYSRGLVVSFRSAGSPLMDCWVLIWYTHSCFLLTSRLQTHTHTRRLHISQKPSKNMFLLRIKTLCGITLLPLLCLPGPHTSVTFICYNVLNANLLSKLSCCRSHL